MSVHELTESSKLSQPAYIFGDGAIMTDEWIITLGAAASFVLIFAAIIGVGLIFISAV